MVAWHCQSRRNCPSSNYKNESQVGIPCGQSSLRCGQSFPAMRAVLPQKWAVFLAMCAVFLAMWAVLPAMCAVLPAIWAALPDKCAVLPANPGCRAFISRSRPPCLAPLCLCPSVPLFPIDFCCHAVLFVTDGRTPTAPVFFPCERSRLAVADREVLSSFAICLDFRFR